MNIIEILFYGVSSGILTFIICERITTWSVQKLFLNLFSGIAIMFALSYAYYQEKHLLGFLLLLIVVLANIIFKNNKSKT